MPYLTRILRLAVAVALVAGPAACSSPLTPTNTFTFTAVLLASKEVPPVTNLDSTGTGAATITIKLTRSGWDVTAATVDFTATLSGFPAATVLRAAHIHTGSAIVAGGVIVDTGLINSEITLATGAGGFTKTGISITPALAQTIMENPEAFYFNVHTARTPGGAVRGQLIR